MKLTLLDKALLLKKSPLFTVLDFDMLLVVADKLHQIDLKKKESLFLNSRRLANSGLVKVTLMLPEIR